MGMESQAVVEQTGVQGEAYLPRVVTAIPPCESDTWFGTESIGYQVDRSPDGSGPIEGASRPSLYLDILQAGCQVREIDPVYVVVFRIVLRDTVDHHRDSSLVKSPHREISVAHVIPGFGICRARR